MSLTLNQVQGDKASSTRPGKPGNAPKQIVKTQKLARKDQFSFFEYLYFA
jgi:hypothetical protein